MTRASERLQASGSCERIMGQTGRRSHVLAFALILALLIAAAAVTASIGSIVRGVFERRAIEDCRSWLPAVTQGRLARIDAWLEARLRDTAVIARHPETARVLDGARPLRLDELMDAVAAVHGFHQVRLLGDHGRLLAQSSPHPPGGVTPRMEVHGPGGVPSVSLQSDVRGGTLLVFRQPVIRDGHHGVVEVVDHSPKDLARLIGPAKGSPVRVQTFLVIPREPAPLIVSTGRLPDGVHQAIGQLVRNARLNTSGSIFTSVELDGHRRVFAAASPVAGTTWWIATTVRRRWVLGSADRRADHVTWLIGSIIATLFALGLAAWRHAHVLRLRESARSQARYRAIFETAPVALCETDLRKVVEAVKARLEKAAANGERSFTFGEEETRRVMGSMRIVAANTSAMTLYGARSLEELAGVAGRPAPGEDWTPYSRWLSSLASGEPFFEAEISLIPLLGERRAGLIRIQNPASPEDVSRTVISILDITNTKRAEKALEEAEERYRTLFQGAADAIFIHDLQGKILEVNEVACRQLGYGSTDIVGTAIHGFLDPDELEAVTLWLHTLQHDGQIVFESRLVARDGHTIPVEIKSRVIDYGGQAAVMSIMRDVTQREAALEEIEFLERLLDIRSRANQVIAVSRSRGELFDNVCEALVDEGGFQLAWIVTADGEGSRPHLASMSGPDAGLTKLMSNLLHTDVGLTEVCGEVLHAGRRRVIGDLLGESAPDFGVPRGTIESECRSLAVIPVVRDSGVLASLGVCASDAGVFSGKVVDLLEQLGSDLGFAVQALDMRRALERSEERYRLLFERNLAGVYRSTVDGRMLDCNTAFARIFGFGSRQELLRAKAWDLYPDPEVRRRFLSTLRKEKALVAYEQPMQRRDGQPLWIVLSASLVRDEEGKPREIEGTLMDLTARRYIEEDLERTAKRLEEAQRIAHVGNWEWDPDNNVSYWSEELYRIAGLEPRSFDTPVSRTLERVHPDDRDRVHEAEVGLLSGNDGYSIEYKLVRPDGSVRVVLDRAKVMRGPDGRPVRVFGTVQDLTEYRALEEQLRQAQKMEAIGRLAGGVAHDFNNILQAMMMFTDELELDWKDPHKNAKILDHLKEQLERAAALTRQMLLFSRRETGKPEQLDLNEVVTAMTAMLQRLVREDIRFSVVTGTTRMPVMADRSQLEQVVMNLVVNAVDAMPEGGELIVKTVCRDKEPGWACLEVIDTGHGISEDIRAHIFDPFFTTKEAGQGTGLGLSVVHGIVTAHGGTVGVHSTPGSGTTFTIRLPIATGKTKEPSGAHPQVPEAGHGEHVLLVEDNPAVREGLQDTLESLGYRVTALASGEAALAYEGDTPDLLLTDQVLPGMTGLRIAQRLRVRWPRLAIILMSGYSEDEALKGLVRNGQIRFLQKPAPLAQLAGELRAALEDVGR